MLAATYVICILVWVVLIVLAHGSMKGTVRMRRFGLGLEGLCVLAVMVTPDLPARVATAVLFQGIIITLMLAGLYMDAVYQIMLYNSGQALSDEESEATTVTIYEKRARKVTVTLEQADRIFSIMFMLSVVFSIGMVVLRICLIFPNYGTGGVTMGLVIALVWATMALAIHNAAYEEKVKVWEFDRTIAVSVLMLFAIGGVMVTYAMTYGVYGTIDDSVDEKQTTETEYALVPIGDCEYLNLDDYPRGLSGDKYDAKQTYYLIESSSSARSYSSYYFFTDANQPVEEAINRYSDSVQIYPNSDTPRVIVTETWYETRLSHEHHTSATTYQFFIPGEDYIYSP